MVIDLAGKSTLGDYMVVASGRSQRQLAAWPIIWSSNSNNPNWQRRDRRQAQGDWVLIDAGDVIVHLFRPEVQEFYGIEDVDGRPRGVTHQVGAATEGGGTTVARA